AGVAAVVPVPLQGRTLPRGDANCCPLQRGKAAPQSRAFPAAKAEDTTVCAALFGKPAAPSREAPRTGAQLVGVPVRNVRKSCSRVPEKAGLGVPWPLLLFLVSRKKIYFEAMWIFEDEYSLYL